MVISTSNMNDDTFISSLMCPQCGQTHTREAWNEAWRKKHRRPKNKVEDVFINNHGPVCPSCKYETTIEYLLRVTRGEFKPHNCLDHSKWIDIDSKKCRLCGSEWYDYTRCEDL